MTKKKKIWLITILSIVAVLVTAVCIYYFGAGYKDFDALAQQEFAIPGLETKFVPQGIEYVSDDSKFLVAGYMSDGSPSRIYVVDKATNSTEKYATLKNADGSDYCGHAGGIACCDDTAWLVGDKKVERFSLTELLNCESGSKIEISCEFTTGNGCDFAMVNNGELFIGEFYKAKVYDTPISHHIETKDGTNYALTFVYNIDLLTNEGVESLVPTKAISMPNQVQGMAFTKDGKISLSTSYSIPSSKIYVYSNIFNSATDKTVTIEGHEISLYVLDSLCLEQTIKAPAMSEEMVLVDDRVFVMFESACKKWKLFNRTRTKNVYSLDL